MDSDGEEELVKDGDSKAEPAKVSEIVVVKVSLSIPLVALSKTDMFCHQVPRKMAGHLKCTPKHKPKLKPLFNDEEVDILFPEPSELLVQSTQKSMVLPAKAMSQGDKVCALDTIPKILEEKHGYPDMTWSLRELVHVSVSD